MTGPHRTRALLVHAVLAAGLVALAAGVDLVRLNVGQSTDYTPGFLPAHVVCDDLSIVRVEDAGLSFRLTGLEPGETDCGFSSIAVKGVRRSLHIVIAGRAKAR